jgi:hypothetical protein
MQQARLAPELLRSSDKRGMMLRKSPLSLVDCRDQGVIETLARRCDVDRRGDRLKRGFAIRVAHFSSIRSRRQHWGTRHNASRRRSFAATLVVTAIRIVTMLRRP